MKKLVLFLTALLVLSTLVSSPVLAARPSLEYRIHSMFGILYRSMFLGRGLVIVPGDILPVNNGGGAGVTLGGDADDYGNGRWSDDDKPFNNVLGAVSPWLNANVPDAIKSVE